MIHYGELKALIEGDGVARRCVSEESGLMAIPETAAQIKSVLGQVIMDLSNRRLAPKAACAMAYVAGVTLRVSCPYKTPLRPFNRGGGRLHSTTSTVFV